MEHPRSIDLDLVNAQQARRILDRLVGYKLSPFLAKVIRKGLSAGRVQSVAVRLVVDREEEIRAFKPEEYWTIDAKLIPKGGRKAFPASFYGTLDRVFKIKITNKKKLTPFWKSWKTLSLPLPKSRKAAAASLRLRLSALPTMQQEASRKLGFQARRTMKAAQETV